MDTGHAFKRSDGHILYIISSLVTLEYTQTDCQRTVSARAPFAPRRLLGLGRQWLNLLVAPLLEDSCNFAHTSFAW
jgi:hypothetical protein